MLMSGLLGGESAVFGEERATYGIELGDRNRMVVILWSDETRICFLAGSKF